MRIITRGGDDWTDHFPSIASVVEWMEINTAIFGGEAVVLDEHGRSDFGALQQTFRGRGGKRPAGEALHVAFELLYFDGHDLAAIPLFDRRQILSALLDDPTGYIRFSEDLGQVGESLLRLASEMGLEGIIGKNET